MSPSSLLTIAARIGRAASYLLLLAAAFLALIMVAIPMATGSQTYTVLTGSMAPKYAPGTFLTVKPTPFAELRIGDVITYQMTSGEPGVVTHRVTGIGSTQAGEQTLTTKGDANSREDSAPVLEAQVKGRLAYAVPYVGHAAVATSQAREAYGPIIAAGLISLGLVGILRGAFGGRRARKERRSV